MERSNMDVTFCFDNVTFEQVQKIMNDVQEMLAERHEGVELVDMVVTTEAD